MMKSLIFAFVALSTSVPASAKEGLNAKRAELPASLQQAWESVFLLHWTGDLTGSLSTAFLVAALPGTDATDLYFLTSAHSIPTNCETTATCGRIHLIQEARVVVSPKEGPVYSARNGIILEEIEVAFTVQNPDLALLHGRARKNISLPPPLRVAAQCRLAPGQPLFTVGYSDSSLRTAAESQPILDAELTAKRWSEGLFINYIGLDIDDLKHTVSATTVDTLKGGSGGPLLNTAGEIAGVIQLNATGGSTDYRYVGVEFPVEKRAPHSAATPCEFLLQFINTGIQMQQTRRKIPEI